MRAKGKNALDFHIAFCLGRLVQQRDSEAAPHEHTRFVIVSKDTGFDALLGHVRKLGYGSARVKSIPEALAMHTVTNAAPAGEPTPGPAQRLTVTEAGPSVGAPAPAADSKAKAAATQAPTEAVPPPRKRYPQPSRRQPQRRC